ncbi:MAG: S8 family serine peptidase, partial [Candidatus Limnocylindrales bacterium]
MKALMSAVALHSGAGLKTSRRGSVRLLALAPAALLLAGLFSVWAGPLAGPVNAAVHGKDGPLTPRLQLLADPAFETESAQAQAEKLMLPVSGPGSIMERPGGRILVDVRVSDTSAATLHGLEAIGARLVYVDDALRIVTAEVAPSGLTALAAVQPQVLSVEEVLQPAVNAACPTGDFVSEGDTQLNAATGRTHYSVNGSGITVGVLSDSYNSLGGAPTDVTNGELPGATNACGFTNPVTVQADYSGTDEGRAMSQIVHDLAPGANIRFATADNSEQDFADQIRALATAGAKVIVDDISYFDEPMYQDGVIGKAVEDVTAQGVTYFSSAANNNTIIGGNNVSSYETQAYRPMTCPASVLTGYGSPAGLTCHDFNPGAGTDNTYGITFNTNTRYTMGWNEPQFGIATNLDLCVLDHSNGALLGCSFNNNFTTEKAFEMVSISGSGSIDLVVVRYAGTGTPRFKLISQRSNLTAVEYPTGSGGDVVGPTIYGHNASRSGATVAAIPYNNANTLETYSSRGPATYCYGPVVGTTPAAPLASCQTATVDMSATDGVQNSFFGGGSPNRFYGTSAAAPHAAAIAALVLQRRSCLTPAQVLAAMETTAVPVGAFGVDAMGAGRLDADAALGAAGTGSCTAPTVSSITPPSGPTTGGTTVTITGTGFTGATAVHFGATA